MVNPKIGDVVHFMSSGGVHCAAIILVVDSTDNRHIVDLVVFKGGAGTNLGIQWVPAIPYGNSFFANTWHNQGDDPVD